ncbi:hypothetical protein Tco_0315101, partial [Tanacetum coccineum]
VHVTHARIVIESVPKPARRIPSGIAFRDTSSVTKKLSLDLSQKLKGFLTLSPEEKLVVDTMKALKERVLDEFTIIPASFSEGTSTKLGVPDKEKVTSEANVILDGEYVQTDDEVVQGDEQVNDDEDEEMTNAEDADTG